MDLLQAIMKEHSKEQCQRIVRYVGRDEKKFAELMKHFLTGECLVSQWAGWPLSYCVEKHPELLKPYFKQILDYVDKPGNHEAVARNVMRMLQYVGIPKKFHGRVMDLCFSFIGKHGTAPAVKAFSLTVVEKLAEIYPEIKPELKLVIEDRWEHETAAFHSRARKILKKLEKER